MIQKELLKLLDIVYDKDHAYSEQDRLRAKLRLEELIRILVPD